SVQKAVQRVFGRERVQLERPLDAVARGAAAFIAGIDFYDHIQHDYAFRFVDPVQGDYDYRTIVEHGTPYPTRAPLARLAVKASHGAQTQVGLRGFRIGRAPPGGNRGRDGAGVRPPRRRPRAASDAGRGRPPVLLLGQRTQPDVPHRGPARRTRPAALRGRV